MYNKKIIAKGLVVGVTMSSLPIGSMANTLNEYKITKEERIEFNSNDNHFDNTARNLFIKTIEPKESIKVNRSIVRNSVLEINLNEGDNVEDLSGNPNGYEIVRVVTNGEKKLDKTDYDNLRLSGIPKIDLSGAYSDSIVDSAFSGGSHITEFKFPQGVITIGTNAFNGCSKLSGDLIIPNTVTTIGNYAFNSCTGFNGGLTIPDSVTTIGGYAFYLCSKLTGDLVIPNSVTSIGSFAFYGCSGFNGDLVMSDSVVTISSSAFNGCSGLTGDLIIPDSVTGIGTYAFNNTKINKFTVKVKDSHMTGDYRQSVIQRLPKDKTYIEISYNTDISGTWLEKTDYIKVQPKIYTQVGNFENNEGVGVSLEIPEVSSIKEMTILKDGVEYNLEKSENGRYIFAEEGSYEVYIETELGTISNISFKNTSPIIAPEIEFDGNSITIIDKGILNSAYIDKEGSVEDYNDASSLVYNNSNASWTVSSGSLKSQVITDDNSTENEIKINADKGDKLKLSVKTSSESSYDWGYIYLNGSQVYKKTGTSTGFEELEFDLLEGENTIKFVYEKDDSGSDGSDAMFIDYIKVIRNETFTTLCDTLEYRVNGGDWQPYTDSFELKNLGGTKALVEVRVKHNGFVSSVISKEIILPISTEEIEEKIENLEDSRDVESLKEIREMVNQLPESIVKDRLQARLNAIFPNIILERKNASANVDIYIKCENMLSLSVDTTSITFEDFSGVEDVEMKKAINLTVSSSLPYKINAYMPTEIRGAENNNIMDKKILNIKANGKDNYNSFEDTTTPILLLDDQPKDNDVVHSIDLMLKGNISHEKDVYKTTVKFVVEQK